MTRPTDQVISNGLVYIGGKPYSIRHGDVVQSKSGKWVLPDSPEAAEVPTKMGHQTEEVRLTDTGNARLLATLYGDVLRYDHRRGKWLLWNIHRWERDHDGQIARWVVESAQKRYSDASTILDLKERTRVANWAIASESRQKIEACMALARNFLPIADNGDAWDREPWLLGVPNGVVDLRTGELRAGRPEDRITMTTGVEFKPETKCPRWERFLTEVFGDADFTDWLHRGLGYSISGDTTEQCIFIGYGVGGNGKGVFNSSLGYVLNDYAHTAPFSTFEQYQRAGIPNDLACLEFKRFVSSSETNDNARLNEARIKALSGCDTITARYLHQEFFSFQPHLKLWLFVNHRPKVVDDSFGFWRRVRLIPFTKQFTGKADDRRLSEKLRAEAPGILVWLVRGCLEWQRRGLDPVPECVRVATQEYKQESDPLAAFIADKCVENRQASTQAADLYRAYQQWAGTEGMGPREILTSTAFGRRMGDKYQRATGAVRHYLGIGLKAVNCEGCDSLTLTDTENDVSPIERDLREKTWNNPHNPHENDPQPSQTGGNHRADLLGMSLDKAISLWHSEGSPIIHLGDGENCLNLEKLLTAPMVDPEHLQVVEKWLDKVIGKEVAE